MSESPLRVLLVEDNLDLAMGLRNNLEIEGYFVVAVHSAEEGLEELGEHPVDLVILDLMLPGASGMEMLVESRRRGFQGPILILTARGEEIDKVRALRSGADDYLTKPFGLMELLARVEALLRRVPAPGSQRQEVLTLGPLRVHVSQREVWSEDRKVDLRPKEFDLLLALIEAEGRVVSRQDLLQTVWGYSEDVYTRTVDTHIAELRRRIEPEKDKPRLILTVRKAGYRIATDLGSGPRRSSRPS